MKKRPNREVYKSAIWRSLHPTARAHILLVAEGLKPMAYTGVANIKGAMGYLENELGILIDEARGRRRCELGSLRLFVPSRTYTVCTSKKVLDVVRGMQAKRRFNDPFSIELEGRFLGYPKCCTTEYMHPTYEERFNPWILKFFKRPYRFLVEAVRLYMEGRKLAEEFLYLMPSQTPCSVTCQRTLRKLRKWRAVTRKYDPEAAAFLERFNRREVFAEAQALAKKLRAKGVTPGQFRKGYIFRA